MTTRKPLADFVMPIVSGLAPAEPGVGTLSPARAAHLEERLRELDEARREAWAELRRAT